MGLFRKLFGGKSISQDAAKDAPKDAPKDAAKDVSQAEDYFSRGAELAKQEKWQEAINNLTEAVRLNPKHAKAHMSLCIAYGAAMDFDSARKHYDILKKLDPGLADRLANTAAGIMILRGGGAIHF